MEKRFLLLHEKNGLSYTEIGALHGVSRQRIHQLFLEKLGRAKKPGTWRTRFMATMAKLREARLWVHCKSCSVVFKRKRLNSGAYCPPCLKVARSRVGRDIGKNYTDKQWHTLLCSAWKRNPQRRIIHSHRMKKWWAEERIRRAGHGQGVGV